MTAETKADTAAVRADIAALGAATKADFADLRTAIIKLERDLTRRGAIGLIVWAALLFAALHYWPPGHG